VLEDWEMQAIAGFQVKNPLEGYRRIRFMMLHADIVSPSSGIDIALLRRGLRQGALG
jgi:hypothetical protein